MREVIINAIVSFISIVLTWWLSRYQLKPKEIPPAKNIKEAIKRIGKRLIKGVKKYWPLLMGIGFTCFGIIQELLSSEPVTRLTILVVSLNLILLFSNIFLLAVLYIAERQRRLYKEVFDSISSTLAKHMDITEQLASTVGVLSSWFLTNIAPQADAPKDEQSVSLEPPPQPQANLKE